MSKRLSDAERIARDIADEELRAKERAEERERNAEIYALLEQLEGPAVFLSSGVIRNALVFLLEKAKT